MENILYLTVNFLGEPLAPDLISTLFDSTEDSNIGLHVAKQLCKRLDGELRVTSSRKGETTFAMTVAYEDVPPTLQQGFVRTASTASMGTIKSSESPVLSHLLVLVNTVVDRASAECVLREDLSLFSRCHFATSAREAIKAFETLR